MAAEERLGPFVYDQEEDSDTERVYVSNKRPFQIDNGVVYLG